MLRRDKRLTYLQSRANPTDIIAALTPEQKAALMQDATVELEAISNSESYILNPSTDTSYSQRPAISRVDTITIEDGAIPSGPVSLDITGSAYDGRYVRSYFSGNTYNDKPYFVFEEADSEIDPGDNPDYTIYFDGDNWIWNGDGSYAYSDGDYALPDDPDLTWSLFDTATPRTTILHIDAAGALGGYASVVAENSGYDGTYNRVLTVGDTYNGKPYYLFEDLPLASCVPGLNSNGTIYWNSTTGLWIWNSPYGPYAYSDEDEDTPADVSTWYSVSDDSEISGAAFSGTVAIIDVANVDTLRAGYEYNDGDLSEDLTDSLNGIADGEYEATAQENGTVLVQYAVGTLYNDYTITTTDQHIAIEEVSPGTDDSVLEASIVSNPVTITIGDWTGTAGEDFPDNATSIELVTAIDNHSDLIMYPSPDAGLDGDFITILYPPGAAANSLDVPSSTSAKFSAETTTSGVDASTVFASQADALRATMKEGINTSTGQINVETTGSGQNLNVDSVDRRYIDPEADTTDQTDTLPIAASLWDGWGVVIQNSSTVNVTINSSGGDPVQVFSPGSQGLIRKIPGASATDASSWAVYYSPAGIAVGTEIDSDIEIDESNYTAYAGQKVYVTAEAEITFTITAPMRRARFEFESATADAVTFVGTNNRQSHTSIAGQYGVVGVDIKDDDTATLYGDTAA